MGKPLHSLLVAAILILSVFTARGQNAIVGADFSSGWGGACGSASNFTYLSAGAGTSYTVTRNAAGTGNRYWRMGIDWSGTIKQLHLNNTGTDVSVSPNTVYTLNNNCVTTGAMYTSVASTSDNYIFKTKDAGTNPSNQLVFFCVQGTVRTVSSVAQSPTSGNVFPGQDVTVTATLSGAFATGQGVYLRYTSNAYTNSTVVQMTGSGTSYSATIPYTTNVPSASVSYYVFTSGNAGPASNGSDADLFTINLNNNGGGNYNYTVASGWTTAANGNWSTAGTWTANAVPPTANSMGPVTIAHNVTLDQAANITSLTINSTKTFTASDGSARTLTIDRTSSATSVTVTGSWANGSGGSTLALLGGAGVTHTVSGTVGFNNVTLAAGANFGSSSTIQGTLQINAGGFVTTNAATYGSGSSLKYNSGATPYTRGAEWSASSGKGYPYNVQVSNNTTLDPGGTTFTGTALDLANDLTIDAGSSLYMDYVGHNMTVAMNVGGSVTLVGNLSESGVAGGDINLMGNWTNNGSGTNFFANSRSVRFQGSSTQTLSGSNSSGWAFGYLTINNSSGVVLNHAVTVANNLNLTSGILTTSSTYTLTLNNTGTGAINGGSTTAYIDGPVSWVLPASLGTGSTYNFAVGKSGTYLPFSLVNPTTSTSGPTITVEAFASNSGGSADGTTLSAISTADYWTASFTPGSNSYTNGSVSIGRQSSLGSFNGIGRASSPTGSYASLAGTVSGNSIINSNNTGNSLGAFTFGDLASPTISMFTSNSGYSGSTITITGTNFTGATAVTFGGTAAASFTVNSGTQITAVVGPGGATGTVSVTGPTGTGSLGGFTYLGYISNASTDWNTGSTWLGGNVPAASQLVTIDHAVTVNGSVTNAASTITVNSTKSLTFGSSGALSTTSLTNNGTVTMTAGGTLTIASGGTFANGSSTFTYGTGTVTFSGTGTVTGTIGFNNANIAGGVNFGSAATINGILTINPSGFVSTNAVTYATGSTLKYNSNTTYGRNLEWSTTSGAGYPYHVQISNNTTVNLGANGGAATARRCAGNLTIDAGSTMSLATTAMTAALTVNGNLQINGTLVLSGSTGGDIKVAGDWTRDGSTGTFTDNGRAVFFTGAANQVVTVSGGGTELFTFLLIDKPNAGTYVKPSSASGNLTNITLTGMSGNVLQLLNAGSLDINGRTVTMDGNNSASSQGNIYVNGIGRTITNSAGINNGSFAITGTNNTNQPTYYTKSVSSSGGGASLIFDQNVMVTIADGHMDFGLSSGNAITTIQGVLQVNLGGNVFPNPCIYSTSPASILRFHNNIDYQVNSTDKTWAAGAITSGNPGIPYNVDVIDVGTDLNINDNRALTGNLNIVDGSLTLNAALVGDFNIGGNWSRSNSSGTSAFNHNNKKVVFDGSSSQTITCTASSNTETFYDLEISNTSGSTSFGGSTNITVTHTLTLTTASFAINGNTLTLGGTIANTGTGTIAGSSTSNIVINGTGNLTGALKFTSGARTLNNLTLNKTSSGLATLATDLAVVGTAAFTNGTLVLNSNALSLNGTVTGSGTLTGDASATLNIGGTSGGSLGTINFESGAELLTDMTVNRTGSGAALTLGTALTVNNLLTLTSGIVNTGANTLTVSNSANTAVVAGSGNTNYTVSWINGYLTRNFSSGSTNAYDFPVGNATYGRLATVQSNSLTGITSFNAFFRPLANGSNSQMNAWETGLAGSPYHTPYTSMNTGGCWVIEPNASPASGDYDISLFFNGFTALQNNQFGILKRPEPSTTFADFKPNGGTINAANGLGRKVSDGYALRMGLTTFSEFGIGESGTILPITLVSFTGVNEGKVNKLLWSTATEMNSDYFAVERSTNCKDFLEIGRVKAAGYSDNNIDYEFTDIEPILGKNYYRLRLMDADGRFEYSILIILELKEFATEDVAVYPNPSANDVTMEVLSNEGGPLNYYVNDVLGRMVNLGNLEAFKGVNHFKLNSATWAPGTYFLTVIDEMGKQTSVRFEKVGY